MTQQVIYSGHSTEDFRDWTEQTAHYMSCPFADIFATTGINQLNRAKYIYDTVHPKTAGTYGSTNEGSNALAAAVISALKSLYCN